MSKSMRLVFFTLPGLIVRFNWRFPIGTHRSTASHACNRAADHFIVQPCSHAVGVVIDRAVFTNTKMLCRLDGVNIGAEEQEFPTILALLMLDHLLNTSAIIATTRIFHSIRRDDEQGVRRNIFLSRILVDVADVVDCASNRIQQGGAAAHTILPNLTYKQFEAIQFRNQGYTNREIAELCGVGRKAIEKRFARIRKILSDYKEN